MLTASVSGAAIAQRQQQLGADMLLMQAAAQASGCRPMLVAWSMDGLGVSLLVTMFPFFVRYIVVPDGSKAQESGYAMDPQVPAIHEKCML